MNLRETILDWTATAASAAGVLGSMTLADPLQRIAIRLGPHLHQRVVSGMAWGINRGARLAGCRFRHEGLENVDFNRNYIIVSNHQSMLDISMASEYLWRLEPRYVSKIELVKGLPGVSYNLGRGGSACIDRRNPEQAHAEIEKLARKIKGLGYTVVIYPEGTRSKTGAMRPFRDGGLRTLITHAPGVPVLPVTTWGGSRVFSRNLKPVVRNVDIGFKVHPPVMPPDPGDDAAFDAFVQQLQQTIAGALPEADREGRAAPGAKASPRANGGARKAPSNSQSAASAQL